MNNIMQTKAMRSLLAILLALVVVFQLASPIMVFASVSDLNTSTKYTESLGDNASTEYAGRVWTDKSVFTTGVTFDTYGGGRLTVPLEGEKNEDFLISYSALATSESISGQSQAPVDVVLILDISGSMSNQNSNMDNGRSRIYNTVQAANAAIDSLMEMNPYTRVAVAVFSSNAQVLLPLARYTPVGNGSYLSVSRMTGSENYATLTVQANNGASVVNRTVDVEGGTNIQMGLYEGMKVLVDEAVTTATINGATIQRVPSVILLSDGSPTYSSNSASWWAPSDNYNDGPGSAAYAGNGFKAILTGAYMKAAIDRNYQVADTAYATRIYTVGMGITGLSESEENLANMTLNPGYYWNDSQVTNSMKTTIKNYWSGYTANNNTGTLNINVGQQVQQGWNWVYRDKNYALTHPNTGYDVDPTNGYDYVDGYYGADNASAVTSVFEQIVSEISIAAPQVPTEIKGDDPLTDGYITYTDPIGKYMEVKDVKSIIYAGSEFTQKNVSANNGVTTYTFSGEVHSPVYGDQNIKDIIITVKSDSDGDETLTVKIPASVIPLRVNTVMLNPDGSVKSHTNNGAFPTRVVYSVGLKDGIKQVSDDGHEYVDSSKLAPEYIQANTNTDGEINFYSNIYTGTNMVHGYTAGDATVEFEPSHTNPFYYILTDMPIYKDREFLHQVTAQEGLDDDTVYYYKEEFYHGTDVEALAIARTGAQLTQTAISTGADGNLYRAAGSPRLNRILEFEGTKVQNATGTAQDFYAPSFVHAENNPDPYEGKFVIYHGNNGVMSLPAGGNLEIRKEVAAAAGLTAPGETFTFTVDLDAQKINGREYTYVIRDAQKNQVSTGTVSATNNTLQLTDGQSATIYALPPLTTYTVTEAAVAGFATQSVGATGTIHAGQTQQALFTNTYSATPVTSQVLEGTKVFNGREWNAGDSFTFLLAPYNDCPVPAGYDVNKGITVTAPDVAGGHEATFRFGAIEFTAPGLYRYTVAELEPENDDYLPGVTYSRALYRIAIVVEDDGNGALQIVSSDIQRLYDDAANQLFTYGSNNEIIMNSGQQDQDAIVFNNTYNASDVVRVPTAIKEYADPSGTKPLVSGMFQFQLKAIGYSVDGGELQTDITGVPMPDGSVNGEITTTNEGHNVTFPHIEFTQDVIPDNAQYITFRYEMREVVIGKKVPGMTYDDTVYTVDVKVEIDPNSHELSVAPLYPDDARVPVFSNRFDLEPAVASVKGTKTLNGRDMLSGESFEFTLVSADAATNNAVRDGVVVVPDSTVSISGAKNGEKETFSFKNIQFTKPGTYTFLVSETAGTAAAMVYDPAQIAVTFVIEDEDGDAQLDVVSATYSNGKTSADFVNTYTYDFSEPPIDLIGTKNLTGKSLLDSEFFFHVKEYYNGDLVNERLVGHTGDETETNGVYSGKIVFLEDQVYNEPGTYIYQISEQIPHDDHKVKGTDYDETRYRYTVVVADDGAGNLVVDSKTLQKNSGNGWEAASSIVFNNRYVPEAATLTLPLIKKVVSGDRLKALEANEFQFRLSVVSATDKNGIILPKDTVVGNAENGDILFDAITFTKGGEYTVQIQEIIPEDADKVPGITYSTAQIRATIVVVDNRNGVLSAVLAHFDGGDTITNRYSVTAADAVIAGSKDLIGMELKENMFSFNLYETDSTYSIAGLTPIASVKNAADGSFVFNGDNVAQLHYTQKGTHHYVLMEDATDPIAEVHYDPTVYQFKVDVADTGLGTLDVTVECVNGDKDNIVFTNVSHDQIARKDVYVAGDHTQSIAGMAVNPGQVLEYVISYTNYTYAPATVTITDVIPANTIFLSADNGGVYADGQVKWTLENIAPGTTGSVTLQVKVKMTDEVIKNQAIVTDADNVYTTNVVENTLKQDIVSKDVSAVGAPDISINNQRVQPGDVLLYKITYTNTDDLSADITVTDYLPQHTTFVSADNDGQCSNGVVTWQFRLAKGESKTVSVQVQVTAADAFIDNKAFGTQNDYTVESNVVSNYTHEEAGEKDVVLAADPQISIDGHMVQVGQELIYTIRYTNIQNVPVDLTITDEIPAHTTYVKDSLTGNGVYANGTITWSYPALQPRENVSVRFRVVVSEPGEIANQAMILDGSNKVTNSVVNSVPSKQVDKQAASNGDVLTYTINYVNATGAPANVVITDKLSDALRYVEGTAGTGTYADGTITWQLQNVPAGERVSVSFQAVIVEDAGGAAVSNVAKIVENDVTVVETPEVVTQVLKPGLTIRKEQAIGDSAPTDQKLTVKSGDLVTYYITVTNTGEGAAPNVQVADKIPDGLILVANSVSAGGTVENGIVKWNVGDMAAQEQEVLSFQVEIPKVAQDTVWTNIAAMIYSNNPNGEEPTVSNEVELERKVPVTPQTGDNTNVMLFVCLMVLSSFGLAAMLVFRKQVLQSEEIAE